MIRKVYQLKHYLLQSILNFNSYYIHYAVGIKNVWDINLGLETNASGYKYGFKL